jgi:4-amino-4-deoxy-L-arabinose transferase-like glycosyltransferase
VVRLPGLEQPNDNYDEGVYLESLLLMRSGYRPFVDIVSTQGPLHLYLAYAGYALGGYSLTAARLGGVIASLASIAGAGLAGRLLGGAVAGLAAALALALSPTYLAISRQALPEGPATALATWAIVAPREYPPRGHQPGPGHAGVRGGDGGGG